MNSCELVTFVTAIACAIAKCAPEEDLPMLSAIFGELGATLATIIVHQEACEKKESPVELKDPNNSIRTVPPGTVLPANQ